MILIIITVLANFACRQWGLYFKRTSNTKENIIKQTSLRMNIWFGTPIKVG